MSNILRDELPPAGAGGGGGERPPSGTPSGERPTEPNPTPTPATPASPSARGAGSTDDDVDLSDLPEGTPDNVREVIRRERRDRRAAETRARQAEGKLSEKERAEMDEAQRLQADLADRDRRISELQQNARAREVRDAVADLAPRLGISDPRLAARLLDLEDSDYEEDGRPKTKILERKLESLKGEYPAIASRARGSADAGAGRSSGPNDVDINARIRERLGR